jgi:hypothetical protein
MTWSQLLIPLAARTRTQHSVSFHCPSNRAIVFGGYSSEHGWLNDVWVLDFNSQSAWQPPDHGALPEGRRGHCAEVVADRLWIVGGAQDGCVVDNVASLCLETWEWSQVPPDLAYWLLVVVCHISVLCCCCHFAVQSVTKEETLLHA